MKNIFLLVFMFFSFSTLALIEDLDQAKTKNEIVLVYGLFGFNELFGVEYWGRLADVLRWNGAQVRIARISPAHSSEQRGEQLAEELRHFGEGKYNIIAHSLGGIDARYVLENYPHLVASITTIGTPHRGSNIADICLKIDAIPLFARGFWLAGDLVCQAIAFINDTKYPQNFKQAVKMLSSSGMQAFNKHHPKGIIVPHDTGALFSFGSMVKMPQKLTDVWGGLLFIMGSICFTEPNDGLVSCSSMQFGQWVEEALLDAHHLLPIKGGGIYHHERIIGQFLTIMLDHVGYLKKNGF